MAAMTAAAAATANKKQQQQQHQQQHHSKPCFSIGWPLGTSVCDTKENNKVQLPRLAQWPSYLTHEIHVKVWVWKVSDSIEQNRKTELTWIIQCHQADRRGVVPGCALVPPGTTYGITVFTTCSVMLTLPSFRIVPKASMITNTHNDCHQCYQFHCCNYAIGSMTKFMSDWTVEKPNELNRDH